MKDIFQKENLLYLMRNNLKIINHHKLQNKMKSINKFKGKSHLKTLSSSKHVLYLNIKVFPSLIRILRNN